MASKTSGKAATDKRDNKGRFQPGVSGNPNGRPKVDPKVREMLKAATPDAAQLLIDTIKNDKAKMETRVDCAKEVLNRVYGKATQPIDGDIDGQIRFLLSGDVAEYAD